MITNRPFYLHAIKLSIGCLVRLKTFSVENEKTFRRKGSFKLVSFVLFPTIEVREKGKNENKWRGWIREEKEQGEEHEGKMWHYCFILGRNYFFPFTN